jgi:hypothetical protein
MTDERPAKELPEQIALPIADLHEDGNHPFEFFASVPPAVLAESQPGTGTLWASSGAGRAAAGYKTAHRVVERAEDRRSATPRPPAAPQRLRHPAADDFGCRRQGPRHGPSTANQHCQAPRPLPLPQWLRALHDLIPTCQNNGRGQSSNDMQNSYGKMHLLRSLRHRLKMRGYTRNVPPLSNT